VARHPETWTLWFESPAGMLQQEWPMLPGSSNPADGWVRASSVPLPVRAGERVTALAATSQRIRLRDREADRRRGDRRHAERRGAARPSQDRRQGERRDTDRRQKHPGSAHTAG
jgi:hypothetical protein